MRVDDILIHPRDRDLIVGTHGRSIWICDDITPLEQMKSAGQERIVIALRPASRHSVEERSRRRSVMRRIASS